MFVSSPYFSSCSVIIHCDAVAFSGALMFVLVGTPLALVQLVFINSNCLVNVMCGNIVSFQRE